MSRPPSPNSLEQLSERLAPAFAAEPAVAAAYLFGSVARGEAGPESDWDIGVVYRDRTSASHEKVATNLALGIGRVLGTDAVDVIDLEAQGPIFCHQVLCDGHRIYEADRNRRIDFESETLVFAHDFRPTYDIATRGKAAALRRWLRKRYDVGASPVEAGHPQSESREAG